MSPRTKANEPLFTVGVALDGAGWHPAAWREADARPSDLASASYWQELITAADSAGVDYVTIEDSLQLPSHGPLDRDVPPRPNPERAEVRLDALLIASWVAAHTKRIGLIPTVTTTHTEPFHVATALQTLDHISRGRAGWQLRFSAGAAEAAAFGRRSAPTIDAARVLAGDPDAGLDALLSDAADSAEVARRLWDSWEDDAVIRDTATGRFLDRDRLHHIAFEGDHFSVIGPSIVPRSPQGQLPVTLLAHSPAIYELAARSADIVFVTPESDAIRAGASRGKTAAAIVAEVREAEQRVARAESGSAPLVIVADLVVAIDAPERSAAASTTAARSAAERLAALDELAGTPLTSDARVVAGSAAEIADLIADWHAAGVQGVRLRPLALPHDLTGITEQLLPALAERGLSAGGTGTEAASPELREVFGLPDRPNRYTAQQKEHAA